MNKGIQPLEAGTGSCTDSSALQGAADALVVAADVADSDPAVAAAAVAVAVAVDMVSFAGAERKNLSKMCASVDRWLV